MPRTGSASPVTSTTSVTSARQVTTARARCTGITVRPGGGPVNDPAPSAGEHGAARQRRPVGGERLDSDRGTLPEGLRLGQNGDAVGEVDLCDHVPAGAVQAGVDGLRRR